MYVWCDVWCLVKVEKMFGVCVWREEMTMTVVPTVGLLSSGGVFVRGVKCGGCTVKIQG